MEKINPNNMLEIFEYYTPQIEQAKQTADKLDLTEEEVLKRLRKKIIDDLLDLD